MRVGAPLAFDSAATASDTTRGGMLLYGGTSLFFSPAAEFWRWRDGVWTLLDMNAAPGPEIGKAMTFDSLRGEAVVVASNMDVWTWDEGGWVRHPVTTRPPSNVRHTVTYDSVRDRVVMLGWTNGASTAQTWEWDRIDWRRIATSTSPDGRDEGTLAFDRHRGLSVLYDGRFTWQYDGSDWRASNPAIVPNERTKSLITYDERRRRTVMFGGLLVLVSNTWEWDGLTWEVRPTAAQPGSFLYQKPSALGYAPRAGEVILMINGEQWQYGPTEPASFEGRGAGCAGSGGVPSIRPVDGDLPWISQLFRLRVAPSGSEVAGAIALGLDDMTWAGLTLPLDLGVVGAPGCALQSAVEVSLPTVASGGGLLATMVLPADPAIVGRMLFAQGLLLDPAANALGVVVSDLGVMRIGGI